MVLGPASKDRGRPQDILARAELRRAAAGAPAVHAPAELPAERGGLRLDELAARAGGHGMGAQRVLHHQLTAAMAPVADVLHVPVGDRLRRPAEVVAAVV